VSLLLLFLVKNSHYHYFSDWHTAQGSCLLIGLLFDRIRPKRMFYSDNLSQWQKKTVELEGLVFIKYVIIIINDRLRLVFKF